MEISPGIFLQGVGWPCALDPSGLGFLLGLLADFLGLGLVTDSFSNPVHRFQPQKPVGQSPNQELGQSGGVPVGQDHKAESVFGQHAHQGRKAVYVAAVMYPLVTAVMVDEPAQGIAGSAQVRGGRSLGDWSVRKMKVFHRGSVEELGFAKFPVVQVNHHPVTHLPHAGVDGTGRAHVGYDAERDLDNFFIAVGIGLGKILVLLGIQHREIRPFHLQRREYQLFYRLFPGFPGQDFQEVAGRQEHQVVVLEFLAEVSCKLDMGQAPDQFFPAGLVIVVPEEVVAGQPGTVGDQVARGDPFGDQRV